MQACCVLPGTSSDGAQLLCTAQGLEAAPISSCLLAYRWMGRSGGCTAATSQTLQLQHPHKYPLPRMVNAHVSRLTLRMPI